MTIPIWCWGACLLAIVASVLAADQFERAGDMRGAKVAFALLCVACLVAIWLTVCKYGLDAELPRDPALAEWQESYGERRD